MFLQIIQATYTPTTEEYPFPPVATTVIDVRRGYMHGMGTQAGSGHLYDQPDFRYPPYREMPPNPYPRREVSLPATYRHGPQSEPVVETPLMVSGLIVNYFYFVYFSG